QGKRCRCVDQVKRNSGCCCFNSTLAKQATKPQSCCSAKKQAARPCCAQQQTVPASQSEKSESNQRQISSLCGCGNSASQGLPTAAPRDLNARPVLTSADNLTVPITIGDDMPVTLVFSPETPPPQLTTR
ncbi:MAG: hypothetical protein KDA77_18555, partial [Planctomycetaceae bacterium]|nr:hypothetical protein [Planctomycetaceae bacterium]